MNKSQKVVLSLGFIVILSIFYIPYKVEQYYTKNELRVSWIEYHSVFSPPVPERFYTKEYLNRDYSGNNGWGYDFYRDNYLETSLTKDSSLHYTIILGEVLTLSLLFFIFKTSKSEN